MTHTVTLSFDRGDIVWSWDCHYEPDDRSRPCFDPDLDRLGHLVCTWADWWGNAAPEEVIAAGPTVCFDVTPLWDDDIETMAFRLHGPIGPSR